MEMFLQARYAQAKAQFGVFQKKLEEAETVSHGGRIGDAGALSLCAAATHIVFMCAQSGSR